VFDVTLEENTRCEPEIAQFWGGYSVPFKLIESADTTRSRALDVMRRKAIHFGPKGKFEIDISKFEYCPTNRPQKSRVARFSLTPGDVVCEKIASYLSADARIRTDRERTRRGAARARDFVDIRVLIERFSIELAHPDNLDLLRRTFAAKKAPLGLLAT